MPGSQTTLHLDGASINCLFTLVEPQRYNKARGERSPRAFFMEWKGPIMPPTVLSLVLMIIACPLTTAVADEASQHVRDQLQAFLDGKLPADKLEITYSDLHGLYGGLKLTIRGTGEVVQEAVRQKAPDPRPLSRQQVRDLVQLLIQEQAWKQQTPAATALPDESRATLKIIAGDKTSSIWERMREMKSQDRMIRVRRLMQKSAWPDQPDE